MSDLDAIAEHGAEALDDSDRAALDVLAEMLAPRLAELLTPGMGSMVVPAAVCSHVKDVGVWHGSVMLGPLYVNDLRLEYGFRLDGTIALAVILNDMVVWTGLLRGPLPKPKESTT